MVNCDVVEREKYGEEKFIEMACDMRQNVCLKILI